MSAEPLRYFDRYTQTLQTEQIYGEKWLRWAYETAPGRLSVWLAARRAWFSKWYGWKMNQGEPRAEDSGSVKLLRIMLGAGNSAHRVLPFIAQYNLDVDEFAKSAFDYRTFNEFFYRALKPAARPIAAGEDVAVFPADGRHLVLPNVETVEGFYVKGAKFTLAELLGDDALAKEFAGGAMLISRLCPVDYHRFHFPVDGTPGESRLVNGWLYSVSPVALRRNIRYLIENKREITAIESRVFGKLLVIEVGATNVGTIRQSYVPGRAVAKGAEKGFFAFGGSCVITLFQPGRITFDADLVAQSAQFIETYARMGDRLGQAE